MTDAIINYFENFTAHTYDMSGEYLTVLLQNSDDTVIGVFKHIQVHDRFYCDNLYGDYDTNVEFAERIDRIFMEDAERENLERNE